MAFTLPNIPVATREQASPYANLLKNAFDAYQSGLQAKYAQPMAEQSYQQALVNTQKNKIIANLFSQILGGGSSSNAGAMSGMPNGTDGQQNPAIPNIGNQTTNSSISDLLANRNSSNGNLNRKDLVSIANADQAADDRGLPPPSLQGRQPQMSNMNSAVSAQMGGQGNSGRTYPQAALASHLLGLAPPQIKELPGTGQMIAITPFGNIPIAQGMSAGEKAKTEAIGKYTGTSYGSAVDTYSGLQNQASALDNLISGVDNPQFRNVVGPVGSALTRWAGTPEQQRLLGSLQSSSGEIALQVAPTLKGAFTGKDQSLINTIKANPNTDFPDVFIGKLKAQKLITTALAEREELRANYIEQGLKPLEAAKRAAQETPLDRYKSTIDRLIEGDPNKMVTLINPKTGEKLNITRGEAKRRGARNV